MPTSRKSNSFSVKRKQINFNLLDVPISRNSSSSSFQYPLQHILPPPPPSSDLVSTTTAINKDIYNHLIKEKDEKLVDLKKQLETANKELQTTRHECRLMANERQKFEANVIEKCSKEKDVLELELKLLKETHVEKVQYLSSTLNQLSNTVASLREQLKQHDMIEEINDDVNSLFITEKNHYKKDSQFIQEAYFKVKQETQIHHPLWATIQNTTKCIKHEIDDFQAWKSIPVADLTKLLREDQQKYKVKSLFGRYKK